MGFSLKRSFRKIEKTVRKVAPIAATVLGGPVAGGLVGSITNKSSGGTSGDVLTMASAGLTGQTAVSGLASITSATTAPAVGESDRYKKWANGSFRENSSVSQVLKGPIPIIALSVVAFLVLFLIVRRK